MTTVPVPPPRRTGLGRTGEATHRCLARLQYGYHRDEAAAVARVAQIRRGAGRPVDALPELWGLTGLELLYPDGRVRPTDTAAENAMHTAVTLWSLHQQSHRNSGMHRLDGTGLGFAVRQLMPVDDVDEPLRKRFVRVGAAPVFDVLAQRLREIVVLLHRAAVPLDYGVLADQLYLWQLPGRRAEVTRSWGRGFHAYRPPRTAEVATPGATAPGEPISTGPSPDHHLDLIDSDKDQS
ncbi:type I-E CRISPR-associated protein Cse2/CasB [Kitasatospora sp. NPDC002965]|uniref:type I-E CRISPR-associated protein Cse2/CasB n=1 Tax=Kitasatospora sp. NPDC002965 TaxID=3154775 RepID=UPI0033B00BB1